MIEHLQGTLLRKAPTHAVISCNGVGYGVLITLAAFEGLPDVGRPVSLDTYLSVKEDALTLFGFKDESERDLFQLLNGVSGVGPKTAIGMLSGMGTRDIRKHIGESNVKALTTLPGIGKKSAERIVLELRDKIAGMSGLPDGESVSSMPAATIQSDAVSALVELGFKQAQSVQFVGRVLRDAGDAELPLEDVIKRALRLMQR